MSTIRRRDTARTWWYSPSSLGSRLISAYIDIVVHSVHGTDAWSGLQSAFGRDAAQDCLRVG